MPTYETPLGYNMPRDMWRTIREGFEPAQGDKLIAAIVDYSFTGVEPEWLPKACRTHMAALLPSLRKHRANQVNGAHNGRAEDIPYRVSYDPGVRVRVKSAAKAHGKRGAETARNAIEKPRENGVESSGNEGHLAGETQSTGTYPTGDRTANQAQGHGANQYGILNTEYETGSVTERETGGETLLVSRDGRAAADLGWTGRDANDSDFETLEAMYQRQIDEIDAHPMPSGATAPPLNTADAIAFNRILGDSIERHHRGRA